MGIVVAEERPDLEEAKSQLIVSSAKMKQELQEIEDRILVRLSASEGSTVDDIDLINTLDASKVKSQEIQVSRAQHTAFCVNSSINCLQAAAILSLIHRFALSLLSIHIHRSLPIPIRAYRLQTLLTLPCLSLHFLSPAFSPAAFSLLPRPHLPALPLSPHSSGICL